MKKINSLKFFDQNKPDLSIILPCFNEEKNIYRIFKKIKFISNLFKIKIEYIFVNNGSSDNTLNLIRLFKNRYKKINIRILEIKKNIGYGNGVFKGIKISNGEYCSWTHADLQSDIVDCIKGYKKIRNFDNKIIVKGKRINRPFFDLLFTELMSFMVLIILRKKIKDINAQPKVFHKNIIKQIKNPPKDFSFDLFFLIKAKKYNYSIKTIDVKFNKRTFGIAKGGGGSIINKIKLSFRTIVYILILKYSWKL